MFNQDEPQGETDHNFSNNMDNLVPESSIKIEANKGRDQFMKNSKEIFPQEQLQNPGSDNSFHLGNKIDDISRNEKFIQKEKEISQQLENIFKNKTNYSTSFFADKIYPINKILLLTTFTEFLFQRFDIVTLFLCIIIVLIELEIFTHKHLYKWLMLLVFSLLLDALVLLDVSPAGDTYLESGAGSTMLKFGLLILLANIFLKLLLGVGLWNLAMKHRNEERGLKSSDKYNEEPIEEGNPDL